MESAGHWPLFDVQPALRATLAPLDLCTLPTPGAVPVTRGGAVTKLVAPGRKQERR